MKEYKTSLPDKLAIIIITIIFGIMTLVPLLLIVFTSGNEFYHIIGFFMFGWMTIFGFTRYHTTSRRVLFDDKRIIVVFSKLEQREYKWDDMNFDDFEFDNKSVILFERKVTNKKLFGGTIQQTKRIFLTKINYRTTQGREFVIMLREKSENFRKTGNPFDSFARDIFRENFPNI